MPHCVLIVDDDPAQRRLLEELVRNLGYHPQTAGGGEQAVEILGRTGRAGIDAMILDLVMPDLDGMAVLERMSDLPTPPPVIVQVSQGGIDSAVSAMRSGAFDFVVKPVAPERIRVSIANALKLGALQGEIARMKRSRSGALTFRDIPSRAPSMQRVLDLGARAARSSLPVLIEGEPGVGKESFARAIQGSGGRRAKPFVVVDCAAIPASLMGSVLFGHDKDVVPGPARGHAGKVQEAHGGTLFLDEIGALTPEAQATLLQLLENGEVQPAGAARPVRVDVRLIAATNRRLVDLVSEGQFREDLFYRLNVLPIWLPPLRDRREDISQLVNHFLARFACEEGRSGLLEISREALDLLVVYDWPGNVRQLENSVFRAMILSDGPDLRSRDFPQIAASINPAGQSREEAFASTATEPGSRDAAVERQYGRKKVIDALLIGDPAGGAGYGNARLVDHRGELRRFDQLEEEIIRFALDHYRGRMSEVAKRLGIGRSTLYRKLREYGIGETESAARL